jgi:hypothetical protein
MALAGKHLQLANYPTFFACPLGFVGLGNRHYRVVRPVKKQ